MKKMLIKGVGLFIFLPLFSNVKAQTAPSAKPSLAGWDGMAVAGYVDKGAYLNFGGPSIKWIRKPFSIGFGVLPTLRIKKDPVPKGAVKNSAILPTAGFGLTFGYKRLILQNPWYYNSKTTTSNGKWKPGIGLGYKF